MKPAYVIFQALGEMSEGGYITPPDGMRFAAAMVTDGRAGTHWIATGPTPDAAVAKLDKMWEGSASYLGEKPRKKPSEPAEMLDDCDIVL